MGSKTLCIPALYSCFKFLVVACEVIGLGLHKDSLSSNFSTATWDPDSRNKATSMLNALTDFNLLL